MYKLFKKGSIIFCIFLLLVSNCYSINKRKENLLLDLVSIYETARVHQGNKIDDKKWDKYLIWSVNEILTSSDTISYSSILDKVTKPISKYASISTDNKIRNLKKGKYFLEHYGPKVFSDYKFPFSFFNPYKVSLKKIKVSADDAYGVVNLHHNLYFVYATLGDKNRRFFINNKKILSDPLKHSPNDVKKNSYKIAAILKTWAVYETFYPEFKKLNIAKNNELRASIKEVCAINNIQKYYLFFKRYLSIFKDGHAMIVNAFGSGIILRSMSTYEMPFDVTISDKVVSIKNSLDTAITNGSYIIKVNQYPIDKYLQIVKSRVSGSTKQEINKEMEEEFTTLMYQKKVRLVITTLNKKNIELMVNPIQWKRAIDDKYEKNLMDSLRNTNIMYVNLSATKFDIKRYKKRLKDMHYNKILFDLRQRPTYKFSKILAQFISKEVHSDSFCILSIKPSIEKYMCGTNTIKPSRHHIKTNKKIFFLINNNIYSYGETCVSYAKNSNIGLIIGTKTRGTNGNAIRISLPIMGFFMTGMKTENHFGGDVWDTGYSPDVELKGKSLLKAAINYIKRDE